MKEIFKKIYLAIEKYILKFIKRQRWICFPIWNDIMWSYAKDVASLLNKKLCWIVFSIPSSRATNNSLRKRLIKSIKANGFDYMDYKLAEKIKWDCVLMPDLGMYFRKDCKKVFFRHGLPAYPLTKDNDEYLYNKKNLYLDYILEVNEFSRKKAEEILPEFAGKIRVVGSAKVDYLLELVESTDKSYALREIGLNPENKTIMFVSHWDWGMLQAEWENIERHLPLLLSKYNIIFTTHRLNLSPASAHGVDWRKKISKFSYHPNFFFYDSNENPFKYLISADLLVTDHTSLGLYFIFLDRPIVFLDIVPDDKFSPTSVMPHVKKVVYKVESFENLSTDIEQAFNSFRVGQYDRVKDMICSYRGGWKERMKEVLSEII